MSFTFLDRFKDGKSRVKDIDKGCKAKFSFQWMDDPIAYEDKFGVQKTVLTSLILRKPEVNGKCFCVPCNTLVSYANRGKIAWMDHLKSGKHVDSFRTMINNNKLHSNFFLDNHDTIDKPQSQSTGPLFCPTTHTVAEFEQQTLEIQHPVSLSHRKAHFECKFLRYLVLSRHSKDSFKFRQTDPFLKCLC